MRRLIFGCAALFALTAPLSAQVDTTRAPSAISLTGRYDPTTRPGVAVRAFAGIGAAQSLLDSMSMIIRRDMTFSDRFVMIPAPATLQQGAVDYKAWISLNASYLITGDVVATANGYELSLSVHDVPYSRVKDMKRYRIPPSSAADFRMALHAIADEAVRVISGTSGSAASRITFERQNKATSANGMGSYDLLIVDSDGYGLIRPAGGRAQLYSPAWSPDGRRIIYALATTQIVEYDVASKGTRVVRTDVGVQTPTYSPDGSRISYAAWTNKTASLFEMDASGGSTRRVMSSTRDDYGASYSPDGSRIVFVSTRLGLPQIYMSAAAGGNATLISPYVVGMKGYYFGPDWSPTGNEIAFAGHWNSQGVFQIMIADASRPQGQITSITPDGDNEDPSWAPDGRHIVYSSGVGDQQLSLYVIDTATRTKRKLVDGGKLRMSDWSGIMARAADYAVR